MQGLLLAKGPGVMKGYFNDEAATAKAFVAGDGWFDTGDLGWRAPSVPLTAYDFCVSLMLLQVRAVSHELCVVDSFFRQMRSYDCGVVLCCSGRCW